MPGDSLPEAVGGKNPDWRCLGKCRDGHKKRVPQAVYDGYGSCPLTVERGKIVLAEFLYGGKVAPSFPGWLNNGLRPSRLAWLLKEKMLPWVYWNAMFKGREWLAGPIILPMQPTPHEALPARDYQETRKAS